MTHTYIHSARPLFIVSVFENTKLMKYDNETWGKVMNFVEYSENNRASGALYIMNAKWWIFKEEKVTGNNTFELNFILCSPIFRVFSFVVFYFIEEEDL